MGALRNPTIVKLSARLIKVLNFTLRVTKMSIRIACVSVTAVPNDTGGFILSCACVVVKLLAFQTSYRQNAKNVWLQPQALAAATALNQDERVSCV